MNYPLYFHDLEGNHLNEKAAQFILSLSPPVKIKWVDIEEIFLNDKLGREYYHCRQLQLDASMETSVTSGQYKLYRDIYYPASLRFVNVPLIQNPETKELLYRHAATSYQPPAGHTVKSIPKPTFTPNIDSMQAEVLSTGYFTDNVGHRWYVKTKAEAKPVMAEAIASDLPSLKLILDQQLNPIIITPTAILHLEQHPNETNQQQ